MRAMGRWLALLLLGVVCLQLYFLARIALMRVLDPQSTSFERSEVVRLLCSDPVHFSWHQHWQDSEHIADNLKRAVIASEDANFVDHHGVEWDALRKAWSKNQVAQARHEQWQEKVLAQHSRALERARKRGRPLPSAPDLKTAPPAKLIGGSTISQQLAKNLFLSPERSLLRKAQELLITFMLESVLDKSRILEIYLNHVEWGAGVFGAEAAAWRYDQSAAAQLGRDQAARLAVMLPAPKRFEKQAHSPYVLGRAATIAARMPSVELP